MSIGRKLAETELLTKLRGRLAYSKQCAPFYIFKDTEMELLLEWRPQTLEDLCKIKGFPKEGKRVQKWGKEIITVFRDTYNVEDFDVELDKDGDPVPKSILKNASAF